MKRTLAAPVVWILLAAVWGLGFALAGPIGAQEWTRFRGPNGTGECEATTIPTTWTEKDYNWRQTLPGVGHSSPVVWRDKVFVTSALKQDATQIILCLKVADGSIMWKKEYKSSRHGLHKFNSFASSTPAVDADHVYVAWSTPGSITFVALDHAGNEVWKNDKLGPFVSQHGYGMSPIVYQDLVILGNDQGDEMSRGESFLAAFDRKTGSEKWRVPRKTKEVAYSTPCVYRPAGGAEQLIFNSGAHGVSSLNPHDGKLNWEISLFDKRSCSSPIIVNGLIFGSCGSGAGGGNYVVAVRPPGQGNTQPELAFKLAKAKASPYVPSPVAKGNLVFLWSDTGIVSCIDAATKSGETLWQEHIEGNFFGSPIRVGDRLYCIDTAGDVVVVAADKKFEQLARIPLGEAANSTPAVANGVMYLRTESHLISLGGSAKAAR